MLSYAKYFSRKYKKPLYLTVFVTNRCNLKCKHCFYWNSLNKPEEISIEDFTKLAKSLKGILNVGLTGGEPFLRSDIEKIVQIFHKYSKPKVISIVTNGSMPDKVAAKVEEILRQNPGLHLTVSVSLDGFEKFHDGIRQVKGSYKKALATIRLLKNIRKKNPALNVGVITTLSSLNRNNMQKFYVFLRDKLGIDSLQTNFLRGRPRKADVDAKDIKMYKIIADKTKKDVYEGNIKGYTNFFGARLYQATNIVFRDVVYDTIKNNDYRLPCAAGRLNGVVYPNGRVYACEILEETYMGDLKENDYDIRKIWNSKKADEVRLFIYATKCFCTHECQLTTSVLFNPRYALKAIKEYGIIKIRTTGKTNRKKSGKKK